MLSEIFWKSEWTHLSSSFRPKLISAQKFNKCVDPMDTGSRILYFKNGSSLLSECLLIRRNNL
uniref:Putative ovule protein n=1 Tax=Solanum chacoense TaxID=4108 RepID=A0A0V0GG03_SOLCH